MWEQATITQAGERLLAQWIDGAVLNISKTTGGTGTTIPAALYDMTELLDERQTAKIVAINRNENTAVIQAQFDTAETAYNLNQIGIWAQIDGGEEALLAIYQDTTGSAIPKSGQFIYNFWGAIGITKDGQLTVNIDTGAFVTYESLEDRLVDYIPADRYGVAGGVATLGEDGKVPADQLPPLDYVPTANVGQAGGVASLDGNGLVPVEQIPKLGYIPIEQKGQRNGVATLGSDGRVPAEQLPSHDYIPTNQKGTAGGVATLESDGKVTPAQLRGGFIISNTAPSDTTLLWITPQGVAKFYYNGAWKNIVPTWA